MIGGGIGYEYRLNERWGLIANANYNTGFKNNAEAVFANSTGMIIKNIANHNVGAGTKFYLKQFYINATLGYGTERQKQQYADSRGTRWESRNTLHQTYGIGYQIPLKNSTQLEIFTNGSGIDDLNINAGVRFGFGLF